MNLTELIWLFEPIAYGVLIGFVCHEATHYILALVLGRAPVFRWVGFDEGGFAVDHAAGERITLEDWVIHAGPIVLGLGVGVLYVVLIGTPGLLGVMAWFVYTLLGAPNDLSFRDATPSV